MGIENMGSVISRLRKEKGITQDELGRSIGVSSQAVSKWECGGIPDTELLPKIADYFEVSLDLLFGRGNTDYNGSAEIIFKEIVDEEDDNVKFQKVMELCCGIQHALFGHIVKNPADEYRNILGIKFTHSHILVDDGICVSEVRKDIPYFTIISHKENAMSKILESDLSKLFSYFGDKDFFDVVIYIFTRESKIRFTKKLLIDEFNITDEKAEEYLSVLYEYDLVIENELELDDGIIRTYAASPRTELVQLFYAAYFIINRPTCHFRSTDNRSFPLLV